MIHFLSFILSLDAVFIGHKLKGLLFLRELTNISIKVFELGADYRLQIHNTSHPMCTLSATMEMRWDRACLYAPMNQTHRIAKREDCKCGGDSNRLSELTSLHSDWDCALWTWAKCVTQHRISSHIFYAPQFVISSLLPALTPAHPTFVYDLRPSSLLTFAVNLFAISH